MAGVEVLSLDDGMLISSDPLALRQRTSQPAVLTVPRLQSSSTAPSDGAAHY